MEDNKLLLEDVQNELIEWRGSPPRRGPIPKRFWDKAKALVETYGLELVAQELKLNINRLSGEEVRPVYSSQSVSFAEIDWGENKKKNSFSLEFRHPNGKVVAIDTTQLDPSSVSKLISDFICSL